MNSPDFYTLFKLPTGTQEFLKKLESRIYKNQVAISQLQTWCHHNNFEIKDEDREFLLVQSLAMDYIKVDPYPNDKKIMVHSGRDLDILKIYKLLKEKVKVFSFHDEILICEIENLINSKDVDLIFRELLNEKYRILKFQKTTYAPFDLDITRNQ